MRPLSPAEWKKDNSNTGVARLDILRKAMRDKTPITLTDNKDVVIANTPENMEAIANFANDSKTFDLKTTDGKTIKSNLIGKSPMFGGGKGAGGGTEATAIAESAQCVWLAAMLKHGVNKPIEYFTPTILEKQKNMFDISNTSLEDVYNIDGSWSYSSYESARALIKKGYVNKRHVFHRDSSEMKYIYSAKKIAFKNSGLPNMKDDKWNPGDIWAIDPSVNLRKELDVSSIGALNDSLVRLYKERKVVGISLKKVVKNAKISELNYDPKQVDTHKWLGSEVKSGRGTFFSNKGGYMMFDQGKMEIRPNNDLGTNKIEILGKTARGGGAGWGVIVPYAKRYMNHVIPEHSAIKREAIAMSKGDNKLASKFYDMAKYCDPSIMGKAGFILELQNQKPGWISAKLAATHLCYATKKNKGKKADVFVTAIVNYAGSKSEDASVYIKVYE